MLLAAGEHSIVVGEGGAGGYDHENASDVNGGVALNGGNTVAFGITAYGGGAGRERVGSNNNYPGYDGASGGGANCTWTRDAPNAGGAAIYGDQGYPGGSCKHAYNAGGGGGAGGPGLTGTTVIGGGAGGPGRAVSITGSEVYYGGGGAGWCTVERDSAGNVRHNGEGGIGGGGCNSPGEDGFGGGGSGGYGGGSGVVIVRYAYQSNAPFVLVVR